MGDTKEFENLLENTIKAPRLSGSKVTKLSELAIINVSQDHDLITSFFKLNNSLPPATQARISSLYVFDAIARACKHAVDKGKGSAGGVRTERGKGTPASLLNKLEGVVGSWVNGMIEDGKGGIWSEGKDKVRKIVDIWSKHGTFPPACLDELNAKISNATPQAGPSGSGTSLAEIGRKSFGQGIGTTTPPYPPPPPSTSTTTTSAPSQAGGLPPEILKMLGIAQLPSVPKPGGVGNGNGSPATQSPSVNIPALPAAGLGGIDLQALLKSVQLPPIALVQLQPQTQPQTQHHHQPLGGAPPIPMNLNQTQLNAMNKFAALAQAGAGNPQLPTAIHGDGQMSPTTSIVMNQPRDRDHPYGHGQPHRQMSPERNRRGSMEDRSPRGRGRNEPPPLPQQQQLNGPGYGRGGHRGGGEGRFDDRPMRGGPGPGRGGPSFPRDDFSAGPASAPGRGGPGPNFPRDGAGSGLGSVNGLLRPTLPPNQRGGYAPPQPPRHGGFDGGPQLPHSRRDSGPGRQGPRFERRDRSRSPPLHARRQMGVFEPPTNSNLNFNNNNNSNNNNNNQFERQRQNESVSLSNLPLPQTLPPRPQPQSVIPSGRAPPPDWMNNDDTQAQGPSRSDSGSGLVTVQIASSSATSTNADRTMVQSGGGEDEGGEEDMALDNSDNEDDKAPTTINYMNDNPNHNQQQNTINNIQNQNQNQNQQQPPFHQNINQNALALESFDMSSFDPSNPESWSLLAQAWKMSTGNEPDQMMLMNWVMMRMQG